MSVRAHRAQVTEDDPGIDASHASAFEVTIAAGDVRTPEQWSRAVFEGGPKVIRWAVLFGWRSVLGLRLGPHGSPVHVSGWRIMRNDPDVMILESRSKRLTAHKFVRVVNGNVLVTTYVHYEQPLAKALWMLVTPVHYRTEPYLLGRAASHPG